MGILLYLASLKLSRVAGGGWLEKPILMKTQLSVWTWTLDFDLGFVNFQHSEKLSNTILKFTQTGIIVIYFRQEFDLSHELPTK